jgi:hypothetical protein
MCYRIHVHRAVGGEIFEVEKLEEIEVEKLKGAYMVNVKKISGEDFTFEELSPLLEGTKVFRVRGEKKVDREVDRRSAKEVFHRGDAVWAFFENDVSIHLDKTSIAIFPQGWQEVFEEHQKIYSEV